MLESSEHLFEYDKNFNQIIIGTDEAGRGPGAGGVFAAAVCFDKVTKGLINDLSILNDSKKLTPKKRDSIFDVIKDNSFHKIVCVEVEEIERINILNSSLKAMNIACSDVYKQLFASGNANILTLVDGNKLIKNYEYPQQYIIKGDATSASIAGASILAKVSRDRYMEKLDSEYPVYNWKKNAGYLTAEHLKAIDKYGLSPYHRPSFLKKHFANTKAIVLNVQT